MLYLLKQILRAALWIFCAEINVKNTSLLHQKGPLLIIANHPNSFLDAIIIGSQYNRRIHFLARGDVFTKKHHRFLLGLLNMIPVYRIREGKEFLHLNAYAFETSVALLQKGEAVLIFIEGICVNKNELQPFKKGTARILEAAQFMGVNPNIHLAGLYYNNFRGIGKRVNLCLEELKNTPNIISSKDRVIFNSLVFTALEKLIIPITRPAVYNKTLFYYIHLNYYKTIEKIVNKATKGTVFYDSVFFSALLFTYPLFLLLIFCVLMFLKIPQPIIFITLLCIPIFGKRTIE